MPVKISAIKCEFCDHCFANKDSISVMIKHENTCVHNPAFKACATCKNSRNTILSPCLIEDTVNLNTNKDFWHMDHKINGNCKYWEAAL